MRVMVEDEVAEFIAQGKNVFAKFVEDMDPDLRPMDEVVVVDPEDNPVGIGQVVLTREEAAAFQRGIAVKIREGIKSGKVQDEEQSRKGENGNKPRKAQDGIEQENRSGNSEQD